MFCQYCLDVRNLYACGTLANINATIRVCVPNIVPNMSAQHLKTLSPTSPMCVRARERREESEKAEVQRLE